MTIAVCMGSSCHVRGSKRIIAMLRDAIEKNNLQEKVEITGSICLGQCASGGVNLKVDDEIVTGLTTDGFEAFFAEKVLAKVK